MSNFFLDYGDGRSGSAGGVSGVINTYASATGSSTTRTVTTSLSVSIGDLIFLWQTQGTGANNCEMVRAATATSVGAFTTTKALVNTYGSGAQAIKIPQYTSGTFGALSATSWGSSIAGICMAVANGPVIIPVSNLNGKGFAKGVAGTPAPNNGRVGGQGEGTSGVGIEDPNANANGGGGGQAGAGTGAGGGGGGNASSGTTGSTAGGNGGGTGGASSGSTTTLSLGAGGGAGGGYDGLKGGDGAIGGGDLVIFAPSVTFSGIFTVNGNSGSQGSPGQAMGGGGGGSAGNIILGGQIIALGSTLAKAKAGSGGAAGNGSGGAGGAGSDGRIIVFAPLSSAVTGTSDPAYTFVADNSFTQSAQGFIS